MFNRPFPPGNSWLTPQTASEAPAGHSGTRPLSSPPTAKDHTDSRQVKLALNEPKRQLIRDARVLRQLRRITQGQMANELGISKRTLEEWLQYRRMPQAPSEALLRHWVTRYSAEYAGPCKLFSCTAGIRPR